MSMDLRVGFIGGGAMAEAIVAGITQGTVSRENIYVSDHKAARCQQLAEQYGIHASVGADSFLGHVDVLFLAVKPQAAAKAIAEVKDKVKGTTLILSIVAGLTLDVLEVSFAEQPVVRIMPNTPLSVGAGMSAFACGTRAGEAESAIVAELLSSVGRAIEVTESAMDAVTGLSGSGPATYSCSSTHCRTAAWPRASSAMMRRSWRRRPSTERQRWSSRRGSIRTPCATRSRVRPARRLPVCACSRIAVCAAR